MCVCVCVLECVSVHVYVYVCVCVLHRDQCLQIVSYEFAIYMCISVWVYVCVCDIDTSMCLPVCTPLTKFLFVCVCVCVCVCFRDRPMVSQSVCHFIIILSCHQHGYPWPSLATPPNHSSLLAGPQGYILYPHRAAVCRSELVTLFLLGHVRRLSFIVRSLCFAVCVSY